MKTKILLLLGFSFFAYKRPHAQTYCIPVVNNYGPTTPGIILVKLGSIDHPSATLEDYVYTHLSTSIGRGGSDSITIGYTMDPSICPNMNIRVWVDLDHDGIFTEPAERLINKNKDITENYKSVLTIPATAMLGTTRMRVGVKMTDDGGHTTPTPCNIPADPLDWHGEIEDYDLEITGGTGFEAQHLGKPGANAGIGVYPNPVTDKLTFDRDVEGRVDVYDLKGRLVKQVEMRASDRTLQLGELGAGLYMLSGSSFSVRLMKL